MVELWHTLLQVQNSTLGVREPASIQYRERPRIPVINEDGKTRVLLTFPIHSVAWCSACICTHTQTRC
jgi:hypothetical protein